MSSSALSNVSPSTSPKKFATHSLHPLPLSIHPSFLCTHRILLFTTPSLIMSSVTSKNSVAHPNSRTDTVNPPIPPPTPLQKPPMSSRTRRGRAALETATAGPPSEPPLAPDVGTTTTADVLLRTSTGINERGNNFNTQAGLPRTFQIGRASCRERVCLYV